MKLDLLSPRRKLCARLRANSVELSELCYVTFGMRSCAKGRGHGGKARLITSDSTDRNAKPYLEGRDIRRYATHPTERFIRYVPEEMYSPRTPLLFESKKIVSQSMLSKMRIVATLDDTGYYVEQSLICIIPHGILTEEPALDPVPLEFVLGIINSRVESFYFATSIIDYSLGGGLIHATPGSQGKLIIPNAATAERTAIAAKVRQILTLNDRRAAAKAPHDKTVLQAQIDATDRQIDRLVYDLYELTEAEIAIVEAGTAR
jgi:TaqI-like C-terminal specificity domain